MSAAVPNCRRCLPSLEGISRVLYLAGKIGLLVGLLCYERCARKEESRYAQPITCGAFYGSLASYTLLWRYIRI